MLLFILPLWRRGVYTAIALYVLPSILPFHCTFLSNHASQPLQTCDGVSARGPTRHLADSGPPVIYFLFYDLVYFLSVTIIFHCTFLSNHASQSLQTWCCDSDRGPTCRLRIQVHQLSTSFFTTSFIFWHNMVTWQIFVELCRGILNALKRLFSSWLF